MVCVLTRCSFETPPRRDQLAVCASHAVAASMLRELREVLDLKSQTLGTTPLDPIGTVHCRSWIVHDVMPDVSFQTKLDEVDSSLEFKIEIIPVGQVDRCSDGGIAGVVLQEGDMCGCQLGGECTLDNMAACARA